VVELVESISVVLIFYSVAILASLVLIIQIGLALFGFDDIDGAGDLDAGDGLGFVSLRSLVGFFGGFGWTGVIMLENDASLPAATGAAVVVGFLFMLLIASVMRLLYSLGESGTIDLNNAVGETGTVYITVPARRSGPGQVRVMVQGRLKIFSALTTAGAPIPAERRVLVTGLVDSGTLLVEPVDPTGEEN